MSTDGSETNGYNVLINRPSTPFCGQQPMVSVSRPIQCRSNATPKIILPNGFVVEFPFISPSPCRLLLTNCQRYRPNISGFGGHISISGYHSSSNSLSLNSEWSFLQVLLFSGITDSLFRRLQSVKNAAARLITGTNQCDHITPVLRELHWLPVRQHVENFKLVVFVYKSLRGLTAPYLTDDCQWSPTLVVVGYGRLTSTQCGTSDLGRTPGSVTGASLSPVHGFGTPYTSSLLRQPDIELLTFRQLLRIHFFQV